MASVGFIGLGTMGAPMARNIARHGHDLAVFDTLPAAVAAFSDTGARLTTSPAEAARDVGFLVTMLPTSGDVTEALFGSDGAAFVMPEGAILIDCTTASPTESKSLGARLRERGLKMIDAAVGRPPSDAEQGTLLFMVGAEPRDLEATRPILDCMGNEIVFCGPQGSGATIKVINNYMSVMGMVVAAETLALGESAGVDRDLLMSILQKTVAGRGAINVLYPQKVLAGDVSPLFSMRLAQKDLGLAVDFGTELGVPLATGAAGRAVLTLGKSAGRMEQDVTSLLLVLQDLIRPRTK